MIFVFSLPLALNDFGVATGLICGTVGASFLGLYSVSKQMELPFGNDPFDVDLDKHFRHCVAEIEKIQEYCKLGIFTESRLTEIVRSPID
mgnify:FL=1